MNRKDLTGILDRAIADGLIAFTRQFSDDDKCRAYLEAKRWPDGPVCPHCHESAGAYRIEGKTARPGLHTCKQCLKQFTVTIGTIFEGSHMPLSKWFACLYLMCSGKKGVSAHQLHRSLHITYKTAWAICHKIRGAMRETVDGGTLGGIVEIDETYLGGKVRYKRGSKRTGYQRKMDNKTIVMAMVERGENGRIKAHTLRAASTDNLSRKIDRHVSLQADVMTDEWHAYKGSVGNRSHRTVNHSQKEFATLDGAHINTAESFFALLKRGYHGTYHHFSRKWTSRYCGEFGFRWNTRGLTDGDRFKAALAACHA